MYKKLADIINGSVENANICMLVITGKGDFFCSGSDFPDAMSSEIKNPNEVFKEFVDAMITYPKLLVAVVNGPAIGIGTTMLALFDIVYASEKAYFSTPFANLGLVAESCSSYTFSRIMGKAKAGEMLYFCHKMSVEEARECGFISKIYKDDSVDKVWKRLENMATNMSFESFRAIKKLVKRWNQDLLLRVNAEEVQELEERYKSEDFVNRVMTFFTRKSKM
ncbi:enoyl-CoA delta isomerase 2, mitochondrial isoform X2 [Belonocnema kinseyi]|nr:enoyl-CoA delta isomerase 2, mitochondrial isoform X2 [Belonocnema kinseyi]